MDEVRERQFPVMTRAATGSVPWWFAEQYRHQAMRNHGQTLERLAERGGLCWQEMWCCMMALPWHRGSEITEADAQERVQETLRIEAAARAGGGE